MAESDRGILTADRRMPSVGGGGGAVPEERQWPSTHAANARKKERRTPHRTAPRQQAAAVLGDPLLREARV